MGRTEFLRVTPESVGIPSAAIAQLLDRLGEDVTEMHGIMMMRHGKVCAEGWWQPYGPGIRHSLQSLSKTYAATAIGIAYTEGLIRLDTRIIDIFPEEAPANPSENLQKLTIRDVLCMGCGMDTMPAPSKNWIRDFLATEVRHTPGSTFMYNSTGSSLLGAIVCKVSGQSLQDYLTPRLFEPIGIDASNLRWRYMPDGIEMGGGGLSATTEDNLRLMKLYADGGVWDGRRILAADYVQRATSVQNQSATEQRVNPEATDNFLGYGFQIWQCKPEGVYRADGAMGQFSIVDPRRDMIISITETALGAHWAQNTLNVIWDFLEEIPIEGMLPENPAASAALADRMRHLALAAPVFAPFSPIRAQISNQRWRVTSADSVTLEAIYANHMSGEALSKGMTEFRFLFHSDCCEFFFRQDAHDYCVRVATDGSRCFNLLNLEHSPLSQVYLHGYWSKPDTFSLHARWIETCIEKRLDFTFAGDRVRIRETPLVGAKDQRFTREEPICAQRI